MDEYESNLNIRQISASDEQLALNFHCGNAYLDMFLKSSQALDDGVGKTYIWLEDDGMKIVGYYNISVGSIDYTDGKRRYKMGGSIHINEFALDQNYRGEELDGIKLSDLLLQECLNRIDYIRCEHIGFSFVTLQSTNEGYSLYLRNDFVDIEEDMDITDIEGAEGDCKPMYLSLDIM